MRLNIVSKLKDSLMSYTYVSHVHSKSLGKGAIYWRCDYRPPILVIYYGLSHRDISDDAEWTSRSFTHCKPLQIRFIVQLCSNWQDFNWQLTLSLRQLSFWLNLRDSVTNYKQTRSTGTAHIPVKARLTSIAISQCGESARDRHQNLTICSVAHCQHSLGISCKSVWKFLRKVVNRQTDRQTNNNENI